jgi:hypothetical protein
MMNKVADALTSRTLWLCFQKNKDNGQIKSFTKNIKSPHLCSKAAMQHIIRQAHQLGVDGN